jgi:PAS domain S-box-containing protein
VKADVVGCEITSVSRSPCCIILESISDGVFTIDSNKRITSFNKAAESITGFRKEEAIGQYCFDVFRANICDGRCALDETTSSKKPSINLPALIISKQGDQKPIRLSTAILKNEHGNVIGAVETFRDVSELEELRRWANSRFVPKDIVGLHPRIVEITSFLPDVAESDSTVLITGPTGSGKELIARAIHQLSPRKKGPFIAVNCAALPDSLLESELFGYAKGAFTGAVRSKLGRFQLADRGTLFLDEISNTSLNFQADLLRILQDGEVTPLGGTQTAKIDVRIVAASNSDLGKLILENKFCQDLYYRLNVVKISLPALRERKQDIPLLADHFISQFNLRKERNIQGLSPAALGLLMGYRFPGNVRELENVIEYAFIACKGSLIEPHHLPKDLFEKCNNPPDGMSQRESVEAEAIRTMLLRHSGDRHETAQALGISRTTLWRRMKQYGILQTKAET